MDQRGKEFLIDIKNDDPDHDKEPQPSSNNKLGKKSLNKLVSGMLLFSGSSDDEKTSLLGDNNPGVEKEDERERRKGGKSNKAAKPPRPPKGPILDAADMRLLKELSRIAIKKRERMERIKALKKMKADKLQSSSSMWSSGVTFSALFVTVCFFLMLILQVLRSNTGSNLTIPGAPQPSLETRGLSTIEFYKTVISDDSAASSFLPPKYTYGSLAQIMK